MKTILLVIAGMGDLPDPYTLRDTPLNTAEIPALDTLARRGDVFSCATMEEDREISHKNALLSILGYDLQRGEPSTIELMEYGINNSTSLTDYTTLLPFVIPGFSGHGVCVTTSAWVRGVAKCAMIKALDIYSPGSSDTEILETIANLATSSITDHEFVFVYVDSPLRASLRGDFEAKVTALETIDRHLVTPIADYVWKSELMINLAVTSDLITPWHRKIPVKMGVPSILYFNNHDRDGDLRQTFSEVESMLSSHRMNHSSDLIRYLCNFYIDEE